MSQSSYGPLFEALAHYNDKLLAMARAQTERTAQALLQTSLDDLGQVLEQGSQQPWQLIQSQMNWWQDQLKLMQHTLLKSAGQPSEPVITPDRSDRRFKADAWSEQPLYDYLKQSYLLTARHLLAAVDALEGVPEKSRERLRFFTRQYVNAMAPSNFPPPTRSCSSSPWSPTARIWCAALRSWPKIWSAAPITSTSA